MFLYILAICLFPQVMSASVLAGRPEGEFSISPSGAATYTIPIRIPSGPSDFGPFYRTYTGHEDLWMFGLLNANARLYSPYLGRFVSPDPLLNEDGGLLDFNPYAYARNTPYRYIDRKGEFGWLVAAAVFAGGINVMANFNNVNSVGDFFIYFGAGAAATTVATVTGMAFGGAAAGIVAAAGFKGAAPFVCAAVCAASGYFAYHGTYSACTGNVL